jgi:hypothetical protein
MPNPKVSFEKPKSKLKVVRVMVREYVGSKYVKGTGIDIRLYQTDAKTVTKIVKEALENAAK